MYVNLRNGRMGSFACGSVRSARVRTRPLACGQVRSDQVKAVTQGVARPELRCYF